MSFEALSRPNCTYGVAPFTKNIRPNINFNAYVGNQVYNVQAGSGFSNNHG